jgi:hypothetical protein
MKLTELEPVFVRYEARVDTWTRVVGDSLTWKPGDPTEQVTGPREHVLFVETLEEAHGIEFLCPKCFVMHGVAPELGSHGNHGPSRWGVTGTGFSDLTLSPSILRDGGCGWHGWIQSGEVR